MKRIQALLLTVVFLEAPFALDLATATSLISLEVSLPAATTGSGECGNKKTAKECVACCASKARKVYKECMIFMTGSESSQGGWPLSPYHSYCKSEEAIFQSWCLSSCPPVIEPNPK